MLEYFRYPLKWQIDDGSVDYAASASGSIYLNRTSRECRRAEDQSPGTRVNYRRSAGNAPDRCKSRIEFRILLALGNGAGISRVAMASHLQEQSIA